MSAPYTPELIDDALAVAAATGLPLRSVLAEAGAIRLAQIDGLERVLHVGSFTKTLSPGFRVGFVFVTRS